jgi:hypothetical protein
MTRCSTSNTPEMLVMRLMLLVFAPDYTSAWISNQEIRFLVDHGVAMVRRRGF